VTADATNAVAELNEANNTARLQTGLAVNSGDGGP
jgi:subtilase family serine protease